MKADRIVIMFAAVLVAVLPFLVLGWEDVGAKEAQSIEASAP